MEMSVIPERDRVSGRWGKKTGFRVLGVYGFYVRFQGFAVLRLVRAAAGGFLRDVKPENLEPNVEPENLEPDVKPENRKAENLRFGMTRSCSRF
jgi:hypothetical protein